MRKAERLPYGAPLLVNAAVPTVRPMAHWCAPLSFYAYPVAHWCAPLQGISRTVILSEAKNP